MRVLVNGARDQIFSNAALAADQHGGIRRRDALDQRQHGLHFFAVRDDIVVLVAPAERFAQRAIFLAQLREWRAPCGSRASVRRARMASKRSRSPQLSSRPRLIRRCHTPS